MKYSHSALICPQNDPESLTIINIAKSFSIPTIVSNQPHGAKLDKEIDLIKKIKSLNTRPDEIVIVEIPGPEMETELSELGFKVIIIDHHRYPGLNRMQDESSLEQFLNHFNISHADLLARGFDPILIQGVGDIDQGFVWQLYKKDYSQHDISRIITFYKSLLIDLYGEKRLESEKVAQEVFENREEWQDFLVFFNQKTGVAVRDPISFIIAEEIGYQKPNILVEKNGIYVQGSSHAIDLYNHFGGFTYGGDNCWGKRGDGYRIFEQVKSFLETH